MGKVALCISGLPRNVKEGFNNIKANLIDPNNPDIFVHTWLEMDQPLLYIINELYQPIKIMREPRKVFLNKDLELDRMMISHGQSYARPTFVDMLYSSWYGVQAANNLKEQYRLANDIVYDYVIRARFDINYNIAIDCSAYDNNVVHICNRALPDHDMVDDRFAFGSNHNMNVYSSGFNFLDYFTKIRDTKDGIMCGETLVYEMLKMGNIENRKIGNLNATRLHSVPLPLPDYINKDKI
jgi:hypothetical protein